LAVNKEAAQKSDVERFNLKKLSELEVRKQYQINTSRTELQIWTGKTLKRTSKPQLKRLWVCMN
jgi:hypothetical protein